ncbi:DUF6124 family protein [Pseudomonas vanderleydeniana]|uniref:DUF3077 domain-containing protein n=1 Tax=Pseudomonas vanderleydeniana TaxID=2745495 RepID=A0A9E6TQS3_9PSED|nr:hypothetical protein [Pseudomonas vanderleydeniana]QXI26265.1 hypothetical protein HU752_020175 [Pseudomonas vanderleydeniana]
MFKPTPNPPASRHAGTIDPRIADRALSHYDLGPDAQPNPLPAFAVSTAAAPPGQPPVSLSHEDALLDLHSILQSAAATAYEHADNQTGSNRRVAMGVVHLIELAQLRMDLLLEKQTLCVTG